MVNYHDPVTMAREYSKYTFCRASVTCSSAARFTRPFNSGDVEGLARREWYIYVSLSLLPCWPLGSA